MATLLSRSAWAKISVFCKEWPFSPSERIYIGFFCLEFEISAPELTPVPNLSSIGQKIRELTSAQFLWFLRDFVPEYHLAKFGCNWTTNKGETGGGGTLE